MSSDSLSKNQDQSTATRIEMIYRKSDRLTLLLVVVGILLTFSAAAALGIDSQTQSHSVERDYHAGSRMRTAQSSHIMSEQPAMMKGQEQSMKLLVAEESEESFSLGQEYADHMETNMEELKERDYKLTSPMLVYAGDMRVQVHQEKMPPFSEELAAIVKETGDGYFEDQTHRNSGTPHESSYMTIRVRSDKFYQVIEEIRKIVHSVSTLSTNSQDVTDHFVDASARADVLEAARSSLQALMAKANSVEDVLRLQKELNRLTESSESLRQRAQQLKKQSEFSSLTLEVSVTREDNLEATWSPFDAVSLAVEHISEVCTRFVDVAVYVAVWCIPLVLLLGVGKAFSRRPK